MVEFTYVFGKVKNETGLKGNVDQSLPERKNKEITLLPVSLEVTGSVLYQNYLKPSLLVYSNKSPNNSQNLERDLKENSIVQ